ncbi:type I-E CRISPR-associated protein Cas6/Cse3/CasE [Aromatoleum diolicum]|uniref:Type I-E CRISPR-associated protein Cas6/Cse3/CasE n=1 Tax=Aromatoleum diolicum TaxID=75796 RepID=A0ABX1QAE3_9RHOO|nr:type I-E CRISPR-associated protein Cas6/Cse3/CasE [Aromatoleum diolicum]NMG75349.1 type I-E CRISPR-associated protein Cas6/Cse3/CasE [Aromatoleum diolicum]
MYLSKLVLDPNHPQARRDLANAYEMHRTLSRVFSETPDLPPARFLWRLEQGGNRLPDDGAIVLLQSATAGRWQSLRELPGYANTVNPDKQVVLEQLLRAGCNYVFRIVCNPTVTRAGKRYGLLHEDEQLAWLVRQGHMHGFKLLNAHVGRSERVSYRRGRAKQRITLQVVQVDGLLRADDPQRLGHALVNGIGHGKAMGLGMLSLAPVRDQNCSII